MTAATPNRTRWRMLIAASAVMLIIGTLYSWAIFTQPLLVLFHWNLTTATFAFAVANFSLATVGAVVGGFWLDRAGPRKVALVGISLWGVGNLLAGLGTPSFGAVWLYFTYGVTGGIGAGMAYVTPLAVVSKWFPDKRGLAGGLVTGSFALGAFVYNQCIPRLTHFHAAAIHAADLIATRVVVTGLTPEVAATDMDAVMQVFIASGVAFLVIGLPAAWVLRDPPRGDGSAQSAFAAADTGYPPSKVVVMPQFYLLWLQLFANAIAGLSIISNAVPLLADLTNMSPALIASLFGTVSLFNAVGRFLWGSLSDRIGCNRTFAALFALQAVTLVLLGHTHDLTGALAGISVVLLCCGGGFGTMPSYNAQYFGTKYMGLNYGLMLSAWGFAGLIGPILLARARDLSGSYAAILSTMAIGLLFAVILPLITRKPEAKPEAAPIVS